MAKIPILDFSVKAVSDNETRRELCKQVREACESHGCFLLTYDYETVSSKLCQDLFIAIKTLFDLPQETKTKHVHPKPYRSYSGKNPMIPFYESFGLDDAHNLDQVQAFTNLMWPHGYPNFCETLHVMSSKMAELNFVVLKMIFESFGMEKHYESHIKESTSLIKVMKYMAPPKDSAIALSAHRDKNAITILCQNEVQGLEVETNDGEWASVVVPPNAFVVIVGEALKVWSNGRLEAVRHRVVISGKEDRYSCALFTMPKEESKIEVPCELVDKDHPLLYRPFIFSDYISYFVSKLTDDALEIYAAI